MLEQFHRQPARGIRLEKKGQESLVGLEEEEIKEAERTGEEKVGKRDGGRKEIRIESQY